MEKGEVEQMLAAFKTELLGEMDKRFNSMPPVAKPEELKGLSDKLDGAVKAHAELIEKVKMLDSYEPRLKKLESEPAPKTFAPSETDTKELEVVRETAHLPRIEGRSIIVNG